MRKTKTGLQSLRGIGPRLAGALRDLGVETPDDLRGRDPEKMFNDLCELRGERIDPCVLYTFRCAVYAAGTENPEPELLDWWRWKERTI